MGGMDLKLAAAEAALSYVQDGMKLGLGTGSTAAKFVDLLGAKVASGFEVLCVPTSEATKAQAEALKIPLTTLEETPFLDLTIDGTDEVNEQLQLIKGGGGALLREKIVATSSDQMLVIADESKFVNILGAFPLPIEVVRFGLKSTEVMLDELCEDLDLDGEITLRGGTDAPFVTDEGHYILDGHFGHIPDPDLVAASLLMVPGVVETGLFVDIAETVILAGPNGIRTLHADDLPILT